MTAIIVQEKVEMPRTKDTHRSPRLMPLGAPLGQLRRFHPLVVIVGRRGLARFELPGSSE
jgi:hypothetical protein